MAIARAYYPSSIRCTVTRVVQDLVVQEADLPGSLPRQIYRRKGWSAEFNDLLVDAVKDFDEDAGGNGNPHQGTQDSDHGG